MVHSDHTNEMEMRPPKSTAPPTPLRRRRQKFLCHDHVRSTIVKNSSRVFNITIIQITRRATIITRQSNRPAMPCIRSNPFERPLGSRGTRQAAGASTCGAQFLAPLHYTGVPPRRHPPPTAVWGSSRISIPMQCPTATPPFACAGACSRVQPLALAGRFPCNLDSLQGI